MAQPVSPPTWFARPIHPIVLTWGNIRQGHTHQCNLCHVVLLTGERPGFCCGTKGSHLHDVQPLPPLPPEYDAIINHPNASRLSRVLNLIFSFVSLESTHPFPNQSGPPAFFAVQGKLYHRIRPTHHNSALQWMLYDGFMNDRHPFEELAADLPASWIDSVRRALQRINPLARQIHMLRSCLPHFQKATLHLFDSGTPEIAAVINYDNTTSRLRPRSLRISTALNGIQYVQMTSRLWEPLVYPLLFPHGSLGWGIIGNHEEINAMPHHSDVTADVATTQIWFYRQRLLRECRFHIFGRLANEYIVDMFTRNLETRLNYI
jgi:hypothetical protein